MDALSWAVFALGIPAAVFAGVSKGGFGSGAAFASASILALAFEPAMALGIMLPLLMLIDVSSLPTYWKKWSWPEVRLLLLGGVPGTFLGAVFFGMVEANAIRLIIGGISIAFVLWQLARASGVLKLGTRETSPAVGIAAGVGLGFTSFISHAGGPVAAVYLLGRRLSKTAYQASTVIVFWAMNVLKAAIYAVMGFFTVETLTINLVLAPFAVLGTWIGIRAHHVVPERLFFGLTYVLLTVTGSKLIWDALS
ncbi:sulfite exporter TauE/SafE family protein [Marivita sp. S6314]|uniref:sulfite exporter TauE/SafE family protein n=1 Tax=Marivita sp. S6314 TaxID=2926406 RepID=UPI001FF4B2B9|nr:sulfite exporter TauE/SafE family protein [Marivita sp. S6314]MCK0150556.1 sulfite exporter TauE/SafE family protein [Marivita sp. S6314]